eukprot:TRINITY_DN12811_c0_g1_i1.p1 TRINITY_DN12811_c0_g1~~TRINITY_DN12811_c0_g1_i1.p1  ORF type:complete len:450 (+),score=131.48 TRINITY_DN12811_c0_g1_i1:79-1350(+)
MVGTDGITELVGYDGFKRSNPSSDKFTMHKFHHMEFYCSDATNTASRFQWGLGMKRVAKSDQSTGNHHYASYVVNSHDFTLIFTAPYSSKVELGHSKPVHPGFKQQFARDFVGRHGLAVRAVGIVVDDATVAFNTSVENGARPVLEPKELLPEDGEKGSAIISEVELYGEVVLRYIQYKDGFNDALVFPGYQAVEGPDVTFGIKRIDHIVGNVPELIPVVNYVTKFSGMHEFAEFVAADVGTVDSGLNSMVLANNSEMILLPINEPTHGTKRKSQIQTYLEQNESAGVQHVALKTDDIIATMRELKKRTFLGGFDFMPRASDAYYKQLPKKIGDSLTEQQFKDIEELGLLADKDDQGILLQVFTKPLGDRPTVFFEIIQRIGCANESDDKTIDTQRGGCGGFGKGNFTELFKSIEDYEKTLNV